MPEHRWAEQGVMVHVSPLGTAVSRACEHCGLRRVTYINSRYGTHYFAAGVALLAPHGTLALPPCRSLPPVLTDRELPAPMRALALADALLLAVRQAWQGEPVFSDRWRLLFDALTAATTARNALADDAERQGHEVPASPNHPPYPERRRRA